MNVIDNYKLDLLNLGDPYEIEDNNYYCKFSYNNMPFMIKTNKICYLKKLKKNKDKYINISITSKEYLLWFEKFYKECITLFHERSDDWFEDPLTISDIEFAFINPLKSNIKDDCFDIQCITDDNRLHVVDSNDNVNSLEELDDCKIIPTFHIKGVKFNNKHFLLDIELNSIYVILDDTPEEVESIPVPIPVPIPEPISAPIPAPMPITKQIHISESGPDETELKEILQIPLKEDDLELNEIILETNNLEEMDMDIESNGFYEVYELINDRIKDNIIQNLQELFNKKKIKINMDISEILDEEEEE